MRDTLYTVALYRFKIELIAFLVAATAVSGLIYWVGWHSTLAGVCDGFQAIRYKGYGGAFIAPVDWPAAWRARITWLLLWRTLSLGIIVAGLVRGWSRPALLFWCCCALFLAWFGRDSALAPKDLICIISVD